MSQADEAKMQEVSAKALYLGTRASISDNADIIGIWESNGELSHFGGGISLPSLAGFGLKTRDIAQKLFFSRTCEDKKSVIVLTGQFATALQAKDNAWVIDQLAGNITSVEWHPRVVFASNAPLPIEEQVPQNPTTVCDDETKQAIPICLTQCDENMFDSIVLKAQRSTDDIKKLLLLPAIECIQKIGVLSSATPRSVIAKYILTWMHIHVLLYTCRDDNMAELVFGPTARIDTATRMNLPFCRMLEHGTDDGVFSGTPLNEWSAERYERTIFKLAALHEENMQWYYNRQKNANPHEADVDAMISSINAAIDMLTEAREKASA